MLKEKIKSDTIEALKAGNQLIVTTLRMLSSSISAKEKEKRYKISKEKPDATEGLLIEESQFNDQEITEVVSSEIKKRRDAITLYVQGNRSELAEKEQKEIEILKKYLPEQLSEYELRNIIEKSILKVGAKEIKDTGKIMQDIMPQVKGRADGSQISLIIKQILSR
jgi:uncharacterized protein YqeY